MPRISALPSLASCPGMAALRSSGDDEGSAASDTGSAVGRAIELWHKAGEHASALEEALGVTSREVPENFPRADMDQVRAWAAAYAADPRNAGVVVADSCEREVRLVLPAAPEDPTGQPVELVGHLDQLRRGPGGQLRVWDLKSGRPGGLEMVYGYALQLAAYALACTETLGVPVLPGGIVRLRGYDAKRATTPEALVFFEAPWTLDACRGLVVTVVQEIAWLRMGLVHLRPGLHCSYCPGNGPGNCGARIDRLAELPAALTGGAPG